MERTRSELISVALGDELRQRCHSELTPTDPIKPSGDELDQMGDDLDLILVNLRHQPSLYSQIIPDIRHESSIDKLLSDHRWPRCRQYL